MSTTQLVERKPPTQRMADQGAIWKRAKIPLNTRQELLEQKTREELLIATQVQAAICLLHSHDDLWRNPFEAGPSLLL